MQRLRESILTIRVGDTLSTSTIEEILADNGFERVEFVYEPGQYSVRGGIVDIFSFSDNKPYRIDLFGDEVDSIRHFDLSSQLSVDRLQQIEVVPNLKMPFRAGSGFRFRLLPQGRPIGSTTASIR